MEAVLSGIPVVIIGNSTQLTHNPIPASMPRSLWKLAYTPSSASAHVLRYLTHRPEDIDSHGLLALRKSYFEPYLPTSGKAFLDAVLGLLNSQTKVSHG
jgi:hypothetical protein